MMVRRTLRIRPSLLLLLLLLLGLTIVFPTADGALPPLEESERYSRATHAFNGVVVAVNFADVTDEKASEYFNERDVGRRQQQQQRAAGGERPQRAVRKYADRHFRMVVNVTGVIRSRNQLVTTNLLSEKELNAADTSGVQWWRPSYEIHESERVRAGDVVHVLAWRALERPAGVVGDMGITFPDSAPPRPGAEHSFWCTYAQRDLRHRGVFRESFPWVDPDPDHDERTDGPKSLGPHAYEVLNPNGIGNPLGVESLLPEPSAAEVAAQEAELQRLRQVSALRAGRRRRKAERNHERHAPTGNGKSEQDDL